MNGSTSALRARVTAARVLFDRGLGGLVGNTVLTGVAGAMVATTSSLFLADGVGATPLMIGLFFAGRGLLQIVSGLAVGALSDRAGSRRTLLAACCLLSSAGAFTYMALRDYYLLLILGGLLFGLGSASFGQLFAYARELAETRDIGATFLNSALRALTSIAWIAGPPVGLFLLAAHGFAVLYLTAALIHLAAGVLALWLLPDLTPAVRERPPRGNPFAGIPRQLWLLLPAIVLLFTVVNAYHIDFALFVTHDLGHDAGFAGLPIGLNAAIEIPVIMYLGARADRIGKGRLVLAAAVCATVFFTVLPFAESRAELLLLQIPNAFWSAVALTIPVTILQDAMTDRIGTASALYSSSYHTGILLGGALTGAVTQWVGFTDVFFVCALLAAVAALLLAAGGRAADATPPAAGPPSTTEPT